MKRRGERWQIGPSLQCWDGFEAEGRLAGFSSQREETDLRLYEEGGAHWAEVLG